VPPEIGLRRHTVRLVEHEPGWATLFAIEAELIQRCLGDLAVGIEHVGSTAVPGLVAKPILDIAIAAATSDQVPLVVERLRNAGYLDRGSSGSGGGHLLVKEAAADVRTVHAHVVDVGDAQWADYLKFRDELRTTTTTRQAYAELKKTLADAFRDSRRAYTAGKEAFIQRVLEQTQGPRRGDDARNDAQADAD
jgi:GrpB-like predicted nucleotidyltransferase (UPF0157 family)